VTVTCLPICAAYAEIVNHKKKKAEIYQVETVLWRTAMDLTTAYHKIESEPDLKHEDECGFLSDHIVENRPQGKVSDSENDNNVGKSMLVNIDADEMLLDEPSPPSSLSTLSSSSPSSQTIASTSSPPSPLASPSPTHKTNELERLARQASYIEPVRSLRLTIVCPQFIFSDLGSSTLSPS